MNKIQIHYRPTYENAQWLKNQKNINIELDRLVTQTRLSFGGLEPSEEQIELDELGKEICSEEKTLRKIASHVRYLNSRRDYLIGVLREVNKAKEDREMELVLKAQKVNQ